jgi:hypothetical protein
MSPALTADWSLRAVVVLNGAMAKKTEVVVTMTDDLDGSKADRTVAFAWGGTTYEIDLSKKNASAFEKAVAPYVASARRVRGAASRGRKPATGRARSDLSAIREWARASGYEIAERGRIAQEIQDAYDAPR